MNRVLVTGATGFIGRALCRRLLQENVAVRAAIRPSSDVSVLPSGVEHVVVEGLGADTSWRDALKGVRTVIHLSGLVHVDHGPGDDALAAYQRINVAASERLAYEALRAGVERFVYASSVKVFGDSSSGALTEDSPTGPLDPYGLSKLEAERTLHRLGATMGVTVVRPPLVYGPGVRANFLRLLSAVHRGVPLPFASVRNARSLVYVENLADALALCARHPAAAGKTYLVSDGEDVSTADLVRKLATVLDVPERLITFPPLVLGVLAAVIGKGRVASRLLGSLTVDCSRVRAELGWTPPFTLDEGLKRTAEWFREEQVTKG